MQVSDDSSPEHVIPPKDDSALEVMDQRSQQLLMLKALFALPQYNIGPVIPEGSLRKAGTSLQEDINMPGCSYSHPQMNRSSHWGGHMPRRTSETRTSLQSEVFPIRCSRKKKLQACHTAVLIIISTALQTGPENPKFWKNKKQFPSSRCAYVFRIPKLYLANGIICHTLTFILDRTICNFRMKLQLVHKRRILDQWLFEKGLVRRQVITVWDTIIERSPELDYFADPTLPARATLKTKFYDGDKLLHNYNARIIFT